MPTKPRASVESPANKVRPEMDKSTDIEILNEKNDKDNESKHNKSTGIGESNSLQKTGSNAAEVIDLDNSEGLSNNNQNTEYNCRYSQMTSNEKETSKKTIKNGVQEKENTNSRKNSNARKSTDGSDEMEKRECSLVDNQVQCVNLHCQSGYDLAEAPVFVLTYFGVSRRKNVLQKVCQECFDLALKHQQHMSLLLKNNVSLFTANFPSYKDDVVVMDSVEEIYEEEVLPSSVISMVEDQLMNLMKESVEKYNIDFQIKTGQEILAEKFEKLSAVKKQINDELNSLEKTLDQARNTIYEEFKPKYRNLPTLNLVEPGELPSFSMPKTRSMAAKKTTQKSIPPTSSPSPSSSPNPNPPAPLPPSPQNDTPSTESNDVVTLREVEVRAKLPPVGTLFYPLIYAGTPVFAMKTTNFGVWSKARVMEVISRSTEGCSTYRVRFEHSRGMSCKLLTGKQLAYNKPSPIRYPVGTRVIALFHNSDCPAKEAYYAGVIAEPPKILNAFRYLVFFDDGYAQYVPHEKILLVTESSRLVYEDIHPDSRDFIKSYLDRYPERPMVKLQKGQVVKTEWNGKWWTSRVLAIVGSLAKMQFAADLRTEWIYRGSSRLGPLYSELAAAAARKEQGGLSRHRSLGIASLKKRNMPYVEYSVDQDDAKSPQTTGNVSKNVAKKSTGTKSTSQDSATEKLQGPPKHNEKMEHTSLGVIREASLPNRLLGRPFTTHQCGTSCQDWTKFFKGDCKGYNPLTIPLYYGFERQIVRSRGKDEIMYRAPCGRRLRNMYEVHRYLKTTKSLMGVDYFDYDPALRVLNEFILEKSMYCTYVEDISYGRENVPVSCVNEIDHSEPSFMDYSTSRIPQEGVNICNDEEFLVCCDCIDDCEDKTKCECWQLTLEGAKATSNGEVDLNVGYQYKRLLEPVATGIYECNQRCKCSSTCFNRVAQHPLQLNLQVFKTLKKGWGLRTLNDIPQGGFICIYAGRLHTEQSANDDGRMYGDEYLAELDYIEVVERFKEGYESEVIEPSGDKKNDEDAEGDGDEGAEQDEEIDEYQMNSDDTDYVPQGLSRLPNTENVVNTRGRYKKLNSEEKSESEGEKEKEEDGDNGESLATYDDDDEMKKKPSKFTAAVPVEEELPPKYKSVREMFGDGADDCYIMDAKSSGNIGRYLNHSCQPNVFVQNVFVDTHDVRFPWVAFFALSHIKAGTELTWDYNYDIGSVPGKVLYCYCNNAECRGRLL